MKTKNGKLTKIFTATFIVVALALLSGMSAMAEGTHGPDKEGFATPIEWPGELGRDSIEKLKKITTECASIMAIDLVERLSRGTIKAKPMAQNSYSFGLYLTGDSEFLEAQSALVSED